MNFTSKQIYNVSVGNSSGHPCPRETTHYQINDTAISYSYLLFVMLPRGKIF